MNDFKAMELGRFIAERREQLNMSQGGAAKLIGISQPRLSTIERGAISHLPKPRLFHQIARVLEVDPTDILAASGYIEEWEN